MMGKSTISEVRNKNVASVHQQQSDSTQQQQSNAGTRQLPQTRQELTAAAEAAALRSVDDNNTVPLSTC